MVVEVGPELLGEVGPGSRRGSAAGSPSDERIRLGHEREPGLGVEHVIGAGERVVEGRDLAAKVDVGHDRAIDGRTDQMLAQDARLEVEDALAEAGAGCRAAVVDDAGGRTVTIACPAACSRRRGRSGSRRRRR